MRRIVLSAAIVAAIVAGSASAGAETWRAYSYHPAVTAGGKGITWIGQEITTRTKGDVTIQVQLAGSLPIRATDIVQAVSQGIVQMGDSSFTSGAVQQTTLLKLPFLIATRDEFNKAYDVLGPTIRARFGELGVVPAAMYSYAPSLIMGTSPQVTKLADLKGLKVRAFSNEVNAFIDLYGGVPITLGADEVAPALQQGLVSAVITSAAGGGLFWKDILKYGYAVNLGPADSHLIVNKAALDKLSPANRDIVLQVINEGAKRIDTDNWQNEADTVKTLEAAGIKFIKATDAEESDAREKVRPLWDKWAQGLGANGTALLADVKKAVGR
jgi:TRAP-type transport system periplasmic protein